jgi:oligopeptide transport system permease protein
MSDVGITAEPALEGAAGAGPSPAPARDKPRSLKRDAWETLRRRPLFWVSFTLIVVLVLMAIFPQLFARQDPYNPGDLSKSRQAPGDGAVFGYDSVGRDVYTLTIYGARASILVGVLCTLGTALIGTVLGTLAGYFGGWVDTIVSRFCEIIFGIPLLVGAIVILSTFTSDESSAIASILKVTFALVILGWTTIVRLMRSSVIQVKHADYVQAAKALGASSWQIIRRHVLPNSIAPVIVVSTIALGVYIGTEATLSYLGIGLQPPAISWGIAINDAQRYVRVAPHMLLFPALFLSVTTFAFITLGDAVRDALDPKLK